MMFFALVSAAVFARKLPNAILYYYLVASAITLCVYAWDKLAAVQNRWRTTEFTLLAFGLAGGWPGALIAQGALRHKSKKQPFQILFWATVLLNCGALGWLSSAAGVRALGFSLDWGKTTSALWQFLSR
jgi:uncharacterized membrane protein YsdA (DUF1294 family)